MQNYFGMALRSNAGNLAAMKSACMALMYHICGYHYNCPKHVDTWYQYQKDKQDNTSYCTSKCDLPIDVRKTILPINQSLCKTEMLEKCLHGKTQNGTESSNGMIWNREPKVTHVELHVLSVGVYDAIAHFNNGEKAALDIVELLNAHPFIGCRNHRKNVRRCCLIPKKKAITQKH